VILFIEINPTAFGESNRGIKYSLHYGDITLILIELLTMQNRVNLPPTYSIMHPLIKWELEKKKKEGQNLPVYIVDSDSDPLDGSVSDLLEDSDYETEDDMDSTLQTPVNITVWQYTLRTSPRDMSTEDFQEIKREIQQ
jgi:hypothetical protein